MAENTGNSAKPLSEYSIRVNELLESGLPEVVEFGRRYLRKNVFGLPSPPPRTRSVLSISEMLDSRESNSRSPKRQRERECLTTPEISDDDERRMHASFLLDLASPEANTRNSPYDSSPPPEMGRKKHKSRYADTINQPLAHLIRPPYEFMNESVTHSEASSSYRYVVPQSPPQSPPEGGQPRQRARPGRCARKAQGCNENTKFRPVISDWTCYKNYEPCPKDSQVGWCNKCWCNKGHYSEEDFHRRKFDLLEDQIMVWTEEFHVKKFEVWLPNRDHSPASSNHKIIVDHVSARMYVMRWREEWERTRILPNIKIRPV